MAVYFKVSGIILKQYNTHSIYSKLSDIILKPDYMRPGLLRKKRYVDAGLHIGDIGTHRIVVQHRPRGYKTFVHSQTQNKAQ